MLMNQNQTLIPVRFKTDTLNYDYKLPLYIILLVKHYELNQQGKVVCLSEIGRLCNMTIRTCHMNARFLMDMGYLDYTIITNRKTGTRKNRFIKTDKLNKRYGRGVYYTITPKGASMYEPFKQLIKDFKESTIRKYERNLENGTTTN